LTSSKAIPVTAAILVSSKLWKKMGIMAIIGALCAELGITRQTLYRHIDPKDDLRPDGKKLLSKRSVPDPMLAYT
jgi:hypothetical protein